ncbi:MAG: hypothetical protein JETCAE03_35240 [Ignavibacteriaceae bacterium]|jgi:hypothetical protein|nr:MAG: hypothetical protein JETCAE03_35240 [Ignavibacteriaceae bacterium]
MTEKQKINYLRIALGVQQLGIREKDLAKIIATYEALLEKKGNLNLRDIAEIEVSIDKKYKESKISL